MRSGIYYDVKNVAVEDRPVPAITDNDVLVKVRRAGICGSDTGSYLHGGLRYGVFSGMIEGHEMVGEIAEMGKNVSDHFHVGDIVWVDPTKARKIGKMAADVCGTFAEYILVENAAQDFNLFLLDKDIDLDAAEGGRQRGGAGGRDHRPLRHGGAHQPRHQKRHRLRPERLEAGYRPKAGC